MFIKKIKRTGLVVILGMCFAGLTACGYKGPTLVTGAITPIPTITATPTPTPVVKLSLDATTASFEKNTTEDGKTVYTVKIKEGLAYANGKLLNADLVIETLESYISELGCGYDGSATSANSAKLNEVCSEGKVKIEGITEYCLKNTSEGLAAIKETAEGYLATGRKYASDDAAEYWTCVDKAWKYAVEEIIENCVTEFKEYADKTDSSGKPYFGSYNSSNLSDEGLKIAYSMVMWGFGQFEEDGTTFTTASGTSFDTAASAYPTVDVFVAETEYYYSNDVARFYDEECSWLDDISVQERAEYYFEEVMSSKEAIEGAAEHVSGIEKSDEYTVTITINGNCDIEPDALLGIDVISQ